jgi:endonuclease/exonuclease/phosphatase family metal-dependent hydrolase
VTVSILSWNIQFGLGVDGRVDLARIARVCAEMGDADILCFQEVSDGFGALATGAERDQVAELAGLFARHEPVFVPAVDRRAEGGARRRFGNLILSRLPVLDVVSHALPRPADARVIHMRRQALEVVVAIGDRALRVVTTHLEYHSLAQRLAQARHLAALEAEWTDAAASPPPAGKGPYGALPPIDGTVLCGDFNFPPDEASYAAMLAPGALGARLVDAWPALHGAVPHDSDLRRARPRTVAARRTCARFLLRLGRCGRACARSRSTRAPTLPTTSRCC